MLVRRVSNKLLPVICVVLACGSLSLAQSGSQKTEPVLDVTSMDTSIDPWADFYTYSCGGWMKNNPVPADESSWSTYGKLQDENNAKLRAILEAAAVPDSTARTSRRSATTTLPAWTRRPWKQLT